MRRPTAPIVRLRLAARFRKNGHSVTKSVELAGKAMAFIEEAGLELVVPGWVPATGERSGKAFAWEDIPIMVAELEDRAPWRPYE